jgi:hypothetical protein
VPVGKDTSGTINRILNNIKQLLQIDLKFKEFLRKGRHRETKSSGFDGSLTGHWTYARLHTARTMVKENEYIYI